VPLGFHDYYRVLLASSSPRDEQLCSSLRIGRDLKCLHSKEPCQEFEQSHYSALLKVKRLAFVAVKRVWPFLNRVEGHSLLIAYLSFWNSATSDFHFGIETCQHPSLKTQTYCGCFRWWVASMRLRAFQWSLSTPPTGCLCLSVLFWAICFHLSNV
jgi:hypothetical protein